MENDKADKTALGDYVTKTDFNADQKRQDDVVGDWETDHPGQTISQCVTSQETELTEHAGQIAKLETDKLNMSFADMLPYKLKETFVALGVYWGETGTNSLTITFVRPWFHTQDHTALNARFVKPTKFHVINVVRTDTSAEATDTVVASTADGVSIEAVATTSNPSVIIISISIPFASHSHVPYLISCDFLDIEITE